MSRNDVLKKIKEVKKSIYSLKKHNFELHPERWKNWDALKALKIIIDETGKKDYILDAGGLDTPSTIDWLEGLGYKNLYLINPELDQLTSDKIKFISNYLEDVKIEHSFSVVLALSVLEHVRKKNEFLDRVSSLLESGGLFICSLDYWPDKIEVDPSDVDPEWMIFSKDEVLSLINKLENKGLYLEEEPVLDVENKVVKWGGKEYTFLFLVFRKGELMSDLPELPQVTNLEINNTCSLNCRLCPRSKMTREKGEMNEKMFRTALYEIKSNSNSDFVWLHHFGDPILHPRLSEFAHIANKEGIRTGISTKGVELSESKAEKIARSDLEEIRFVFLGVGDEFNKYQKEGNWDDVMSNIRYFLELEPSPKITFKLLLSPLLKTSEDRFNKIFEDFNTDTTRSHNWRGDSEDINENCSYRQMKCKHPQRHLNILWNGDVVPCCFDYDGFYVVGNIKNDRLDRIFHNDKMQHLRNLIKRGRSEEIELCRFCDGA